MKICIIGMGNMGAKYAAMILQGKVPGLELAAVTRIGAAGAESVRGLLPETLPVYPSAEALFAALDKGEVQTDAVLIATPHYSHEEIACKAFARGLHVLCEKPAGVYSRQAREIEDAYEAACAKKPGLMYGTMFQQRTFPVYQTLHKLIQSGQYGGIKRVSWVVTDWYRPNAYYTANAWRGTWARDGGGTLLNQCPHNLDLLQWLCGQPARVQAFCHNGKYHPIEVEDDVTAYLEWPGGATGVFIASTGEAPGTNRLEIALDDALVEYDGQALRVNSLDKPEKEYRFATGGDVFAKPASAWQNLPYEGSDGAYEKMLTNFAAACAGEQPLIAPGNEAIYSLLLANGMYLSSWEKRMIELPVPGAPEEKIFEAAFVAHLQQLIETAKGGLTK